MGRRVAEATKARLIRRTRGDGGFRRFAVFLPLRAEEAFAVEPEAGFLAFDEAVLVAGEVFAVEGGVCAPAMTAKTKQQRMSGNSARTRIEELRNATYLVRKIGSHY
jgi:hypothetical protein